MKKKKLNILISSIGGLFIYDVIESLRKSKEFEFRIFGIDKDISAYNKSLFDVFLQSPDVNKKGNQYKKFFFKIIQKFKINFFLPFSDAEVNFIIKNNKQIIKKLPELKISFDIIKNNNIFINKEKFYLFCKNNKINSFNYEVISNIKKIKKTSNKKLILKKSLSSGSRNIFLIDEKIKKPYEILEKRKTLVVNFNFIKKQKLNSRYILMPYLNGNAYDVDCLSQNGKVIKILVRKRMLLNEFMYYSSGHKIIKNKGIEKKIQKIIKLIKFSGLSNFDVIKVNNKINIIDMAARPSGSVSVGKFAGYNFVLDLIKLTYKFKIKKSKNSINKIIKPFLMFKKCYNVKRIEKYVPYYLDQNKL